MNRPVSATRLPRPADPLLALTTPGSNSIGRQILLRRLARLDVAICRQNGEPVMIRSASGTTAAVRAGRWSENDIRELLHELGISPAAFQDTR